MGHAAEREDNEYEAPGEPLEIFTLTLPDLAAPRGRGFKGQVCRTWRLSPAAAQQLEESFTKHSSDRRTKVRVYRGDRELQAEREDRDDTSLPAPAPVDEASPLAPERQHLQMLHDSIRLAQQRLAALEAEIAGARERRDRELASHDALISTSSGSMLTLLRQHRDHVVGEQQRTFNLDRQAGEQIEAAWSQVVNNGAHLEKVRKLLLEGVMADRVGKYMEIGTNALKDIAGSPIGQVLALNLAASAAGLANDFLAPKIASGEARKVQPKDVLVGAAISGSNFTERRELLSNYVPLGSPLVGQALLMGPAFCLGEVSPEAIQELCSQSTTGTSVH